MRLFTDSSLRAPEKSKPLIGMTAAQDKALTDLQGKPIRGKSNKTFDKNRREAKGGEHHSIESTLWFQNACLDSTLHLMDMLQLFMKASFTFYTWGQGAMRGEGVCMVAVSGPGRLTELACRPRLPNYPLLLLGRSSQPVPRQLRKEKRARQSAAAQHVAMTGNVHLRTPCFNRLVLLFLEWGR